jgi:hypothetical protein
MSPERSDGDKNRQVPLPDVYRQLDDHVGPDEAPYDLAAGLGRLVNWMSGEAPSSPGTLPGQQPVSIGYASVHTGQRAEIIVGGGVVFGRGPDVDLRIGPALELSRRAGVIRGTSDGAWVANLSRIHALYVESDGYRVRLPPMAERGTAADGWFIRAGTVRLGSRTMLDRGLPLRVVVDIGAAADRMLQGGERDDTVLPLYLDPMTRIFMVALLWCRPRLIAPAQATPLPRASEIARATLEVTGALGELERFDEDPAFRDRLTARVAEHMKVLRRKITDRRLAPVDARLSDEVVVNTLIEHSVITAADLDRLGDPAWAARQEGLGRARS